MKGKPVIRTGSRTLGSSYVSLAPYFNYPLRGSKFPALSAVCATRAGLQRDKSTHLPVFAPNQIFTDLECHHMDMNPLGVTASIVRSSGKFSSIYELQSRNVVRAKPLVVFLGSRPMF